MPLSILYLNYEFPPIGGGGSSSSSDLAKQLSRRGHKIDVVTSHIKGLPYQEVSDIRVIRLPVLRRHLGFCNVFEMGMYVIVGIPFCFFYNRRKSYDVIVSHFIFPTSLLALALKKIYGIPMVVVAHGSDVPGHDESKLVVCLHKILKPFWNSIVKNAAHVVFPSSYLMELALKSVPSIKAKVIGHGTDVLGNHPAARQHRVLIVSRLFQAKGIDLFLNCVIKNGIDWHVDIVGDGPFRDQITSLAQQAGSMVNVWGWVDREGERYRQFFTDASIFVFLSLKENFPIVLLDAMKHGMAILASDIPANREVMGDAGLYVDPSNGEDVYANLTRLKDSPALRKDLGEKARRRAAAFSWEKVGESYEEILMKSLSKTNG